MDKTPKTLLKGMQKSAMPVKGKDEPKDAIKGFVGKSNNSASKLPPPPTALTSTPIKVATPGNTPNVPNKRETPSSARKTTTIETPKVVEKIDLEEKPSFSLVDSFLIWLNVLLFLGIIMTLAAVALFILTLNKVEQ